MAIPNAAKSGFTLDDLVRQGPDAITQKRKLAEALLAQSQGIQDIKSPWQGMAQLAQALVGNLKGARLDRAEREGKEGANTLFSAGMGMGEYPAAPGSSASAPSMDRYAGMADGPKGQEEYRPGDDYFANIRAAESGGSDTAKNPNSSATGRYQFIGSTWDGLRRSHPELGLTADGRLDPNQQERAIRAFTADNAKELSSAAIPLTGGNLYAAHFLGSDGARKVLSSDPGASVASIVGSGVVNANPFLRGMTVADFSRWAARKGGNQVVNLGQPAPAAAGAPVQVASLDPSIGVPPAAGAAPPPNQAAIGQALIEQGIDPNGPQAQAFASIGAGGSPPAMPPPGAPVDPAQAAASNGIVDLGPGKPGEIRKGPDGKQYQYVETSGMAGANGPQGWIPVNEAAQVPIPAPAAGAPVAPVGQGTPPPAQAQLAQALIGGQPDIGLSMGVTPHAPGETSSLQSLMGMMGSPDAAYMSPQQQKLIEALIGQKMDMQAKQSDPAYQLGLEKSRLELDALKNPQMTPAQKAELEWKQKEFDAARGDKAAEYELNVKKFGAEEADRMRQEADREADNKRADAAEDRQRREGLTTTGIKEYEAYKRDEVNAGRTPLGRLEYEQELKKAGASNTNVSVDGGMKLTEGQSKDIGFFSRGIAANDALAAREQELTNLGSNIAGKFGVPGNYYKDPKYRQAERDGREVLAVILRKDTGAAVTPDEFETYGQMYLPWPGDDAATVADKREARDRALRGIELGLGTAEPLAKAVREKYEAEKEAKKRKAPTATSKPVSEMSDEELQAIINGE